MAAQAKKIQGIIPPLSTLVDKNGVFDANSTGKLIDSLIDAGVDGFLILGSAGEFFTMSAAQRKEVAEFCLKHIDGRVISIVGTGACSTAETIELSCHAATYGADAVMVINPYYSPMSEDCLFHHYMAVASASPVPVMVYNFPGMTGQDISVELIGRLADAHENIKGLKDSVSDIAHTRRVQLEVASKHPDFAVFAGFDDHVLNNLVLGGAGGIPGTALFAPQFICGMYKAFKQGDFKKAFELHKKVSEIITVYSIETPYFGTLKEAARLCGTSSGETHVIEPSKSLSAKGHEKLNALLKANNLLQKN